MCEMYFVKPYYTQFQIKVPTNMYKVSSLFECKEGCKSENNLGLKAYEELNKLQDILIFKQKTILDKIKAIKDELFLCNKNSKSQSKQNFLIYLNPCTIEDLPTSIIVLLKMLTDKFNDVQITIYKHSSYKINTVFDYLKGFNLSQTSNACRDSKKNLDIKIILKKSDISTKLSDNLGKFYITGEINISRLLWRLLPSNYTLTESEEIKLDMIIESLLKFENNQIKNIFNEPCIQNITPKAQTSYTIDESLSLVDICIWSIIYKIVTLRIPLDIKEPWKKWFSHFKNVTLFNIF